MTRRTSPGHTRTSALAALGVALTLLLGTPGPAIAAGDSPDLPPPPPASVTHTGYKAKVTITYDGDRVPNRHHTTTRMIPVTCWWTPAPGSYADPKAILNDYISGGLAQNVFNKYAGASWAAGMTFMGAVANSRTEFEHAVGTKLAWYMAVCRDGASSFDYFGFAGSLGRSIVFRAFPLSAKLG